MEQEKSLLDAFLKGGWLVPLVGAAAMFARLLSSDTKHTFAYQAKRVAMAAIASGVSWFVLEQTDISSLYKAITYGIIGVISPELIAGLVAIANKFASNPEGFFSKFKFWS